MELRTCRLPYDVEYCLDGALEANEISAFDHAAISLYGDTETIDTIWNRTYTTGRGWRNGRRFLCLDTNVYAREIVATLPMDVRRGLVATGLTYARKQITDLAEVFAWWNFEDSTVGGAMEPFRKRRQCNERYEPFKRTQRRLFSPKAIRRHVKIDMYTELDHLRTIMTGMTSFGWPDHPREAEALDALRIAQMEQHQRRKEEGIRQMMQRGLATVRPKPITRLGLRKQHRIATKSANAAVMVLGRDPVSRFMHGAPISLPGEQITLEAKLIGSIWSTTGHGNMTVDVKSHAGERLAGLCVYFDATPVLDQLAALALHISAGNELAVLAAANVTSLTPEGGRHPIFAERAAARQTTGFPPSSDYQIRNEVMRRYHADVGHHYRSAVEVQVFGRDVKRVRQFWALA